MKRQCHPQETVQQTLDWKSVPQMPRVRTTDGHVMDWDRHAIVAQLLKETQLSKKFYRIDPITVEEAEEISKEVDARIKKIGLKHLSGPLVRELVNVALLERGHPEWRNISTRVGTPVYDAHQIDVGSGFEANENANLQDNAETSHKKKADKISKEQYLLLLPPKLADSHLNGDIHIHDLEYLGTRSFCMDWDLRYFFYYGLMPDGSGTKSSVAGPAKKAEVAILHAVKALGSAQTNFAGGQGFYNFLTFLAPYLEGMSYEEIEQLMQMFVYEMTQMMVARGGQLVFSSVQLAPGVPKLWKDKPVVYRGRIHNGDPAQAPLRTYSEFEREVRISFKALMNVMLGGDYWGKPFNFPKPEISIEPDFIVEDEEFNANHPDLPTYSELYDLTFELSAKFGAPYFDNQIPEYRGAGEGISCYQCCAYNFSSNADTDSDFDDKLIFKDGKHFSMGAWQVIS
ncbi:MAG: anaerobic ribonucleoside-triphosphate reductase, partial [Euryarchaeota archaeon]|nr:anaerobic ribonucleoside-triphosphate reductase [Euryarchaeota archaeon]